MRTKARTAAAASAWADASIVASLDLTWTASSDAVGPQAPDLKVRAAIRQKRIRALTLQGSSVRHATLLTMFHPPCVGRPR